MDVRDAPADWYWEGNVVEALARYLEGAGWIVTGKADTRTRERGVDITANKVGRTLLVEVKGYPTIGYRDPRRAGERKPTNPTLQAQHWYSHAVLKAMRLQTEHPEAVVAIGLPDFPRYRTLVDETRQGLERLRVALLVVRETGEVEPWNFDA